MTADVNDGRIFAAGGVNTRENQVAILLIPGQPPEVPAEFLGV